MTCSLKIVLVPRIAALADWQDVIYLGAGHPDAITFQAQLADLAQRVARENECPGSLPACRRINLSQRIVFPEVVMLLAIRCAIVFLAVQLSASASDGRRGWHSVATLLGVQRRFLGLLNDLRPFQIASLGLFAVVRL